MKLKVLVANEEALRLLIVASFDDAQIAWDMEEAIEVVEKAIKKFHEKRTAYIKQHGVPKENTANQFSMPDPAEFQKAVMKLLEVDVKVKFPTFTVKELAGMKITPDNIRKRALYQTHIKNLQV